VYGGVLVSTCNARISCMRRAVGWPPKKADKTINAEQKSSKIVAGNFEFVGANQYFVEANVAVAA